MDALLLKDESRLHSCRSNGLRARPLYLQLQGDISDIVPDVQSDFEVIERYYGEIRRAISQCFSDISCVYQQAWQTEGEFVLALDRENRKAQHLRDALRALNTLIDPRRVSGGKSLMQLSPQRFDYYAAKVETALIAKLFEAMVVRDDRGNIVDFRWDIIGGILDKDYANISERQLAALTQALIAMENPAFIERFFNAMATQMSIEEVKALFSLRPGQSAQVVFPDGVYPFCLCPDKLAAIQRHLGIAYDRELAGAGSDARLAGILQRYALAETIFTAMSGGPLWGGANGPISIQGVPCEKRDGTEFTLSTRATSASPSLGELPNDVLLISPKAFSRTIPSAHIRGYELEAFVTSSEIEGARIRYLYSPDAERVNQLMAGSISFFGGPAGKVFSGLSLLSGLNSDGGQSNLQGFVDSHDNRSAAQFNSYLKMNSVTITDGQGNTDVISRPSTSTSAEGVDSLNEALRRHGSDRQVTQQEIRNNPNSVLDYYVRLFH